MSQAGKGALPYDHPQCVGAIGSTGTTAANALATEADVVIGIGTRYSDFTTRVAHRVQQPRRAVRQHQRRVARLGQAGRLSVVSDAREAIEALGAGARRVLGRRRIPRPHRRTRQRVGRHGVGGVPRRRDGAALNQNQVIGLANTLSRPARRRGVRGRLDAR